MKFSRNINSNTDYPSLHVVFSENYDETSSYELGLTVLNYNASETGDQNV